MYSSDMAVHNVCVDHVIFSCRLLMHYVYGAVIAIAIPDTLCREVRTLLTSCHTSSPAHVNNALLQGRDDLELLTSNSLGHSLSLSLLLACIFKSTQLIEEVSSWCMQGSQFVVIVDSVCLFLCTDKLVCGHVFTIPTTLN